MISEADSSGRLDDAGVAVTPACPDGVLNVYKEAGYTSHDVVVKIRRLLGGAKVGHAGTLDPAATGVLPVLVGRATRIAEYLLDWDKEYRALLRLGEVTDTQDATGVVLQSRPTAHLTEEQVREAIARFQGRLAQVPPMYSAVKVAGVPLYKSARAGRTVARQAREVTVHRLEVLGFHGRDVALSIVCSKGTYVRTLCADIGEALGVGGHLVALERRRVGPLAADRAVRLEEIGADALPGWFGAAFLSLDEALAAMPTLVVDSAFTVKVLHGVPLVMQASAAAAPENAEAVPAGAIVRLKDGAGRLLGLGQMPADGRDAPPVAGGRDRPEGRIRILKVFAEVSQQG
jgi:tRNA pseudouridine55 synthase